MLILKKLQIYLKTIITISILTFLIFIPDWNIFLKQEPSFYLLLVLFIINNFIALAFMNIRWRLIINQFSKNKNDFFSDYKIYLKALFLNNILPGSIGGDLYRIKESRFSRNITYKKASFIVLLERTFGALALLSILYIAVYFLYDQSTLNLFQELNNFYFYLLFLIIIIFLGICRNFLNIKLNCLISIFILSIASQALIIGTSSLIMINLIPFSDFYWGSIIFPISHFSTIIPISIGGHGVREGVEVGLLNLLGAELELSTLFSLVIYLAKLFTSILGILFIFFNEKLTKANMPSLKL